ncbi:alpha-tocopherol transfer protein-like isoform X2 [Uloborus diversus]|uniref:alpha-tocopherol transfer protein-like isoform X2 n=1 Tax=Uloborus diversus TaxID=327109 RepID=UPI002409BF74|nr:alpha-tocopherol transfer protein-like isoform X2 [Uloborus diversus]
MIILLVSLRIENDFQLFLGVPNLNPCTDDDYLLLFLRARKFDCDSAFNLLQNFYTIRSKYPDLLQPISKIEPLLRKGAYCVLPYRDEEGRAINVTSISAWDPDVYSFWDVLAALLIAAASTVYDPVTQINGFIFICDVQGFSKKHFLEMSSLKKLSVFSSIMNDYNPIRLKKILVVNTPQLVESFCMLMKPLLSQKLGDRVQLIGSDMNELHQFLDPAILPQEYGGKLPSLDFHKFSRIVHDREEYINYIRQFDFTKTEKTEKYTKMDEADIW